MLWIKVKGAGTADDQQARIRAREDIGEVLRCRGIKRQRLFLPSTESINDGVKAGDIFLREVEDVLLAVILCLRVVLIVAAERDDLMTAAQRLGDDFFATRPFAATTAIFMMISPFLIRANALNRYFM